MNSVQANCKESNLLLMGKIVSICRDKWKKVGAKDAINGDGDTSAPLLL